MDRSTITRAFVAGAVGKAIYKQGERYFVIGAQGEEPTECRLGDIGLILDSGVELIEVSCPDMHIDRLKDILGQEKAAQEALTMALGGLDRDLTAETRLMFIEAADEAVRDERIYTFVRNRLLSRPLPEGADQEGAIGLSKLAVATGVGSLYEKIKSYQGAILKVAVAWNRIAPALFKFEEELHTAEAALVDCGIFADLASALSSGDSNKLRRVAAHYSQESELCRRLPRGPSIVSSIVGGILDWDGALGALGGSAWTAADSSAIWPSAEGYAFTWAGTVVTLRPGRVESNEWPFPFLGTAVTYGEGLQVGPEENPPPGSTAISRSFLSHVPAKAGQYLYEIISHQVSGDEEQGEDPQTVEWRLELGSLPNIPYLLRANTSTRASSFGSEELARLEAWAG